MKYILSYKQAHNHFIDIEFIADAVNTNTVTVQLPSWRPGRYELSNFAKNIQQFGVFDKEGNALTFHKTTKDTWLVNTKGVDQLHVKYNYFANEMTAGSTFLDENQLYVNPVNCCVYIPERIGETCELDIHVPEKYKLAIGNPSAVNKGVHTCQFDNFHGLADNPFIVSDTLQHSSYICNDITFNIWIQGECRPDWKRITADFEKFTQVQLEMMKEFPNKEFHFLIHILPQRVYHGVEHTTSTVIALGPGHSLMEGVTYEDLLGVCSHELFHVWNVKTIRPIEMQPYDYSKENYSKLGYVAEGVTTYYGDYFLFESGVFNQEQYFKTLNERIQRHFDNFGRYNLSVADSSFDSWLDGYVKGIPHRKTSIYGEGCLLAFATDIFIRRNSENKHSLADVMRHLYTEFALKDRGYSDIDYKESIEKFSGCSYDSIFDKYINQPADFTELLDEAMEYIGCRLDNTPSVNSHECKLGIKITDSTGVCRVVSIAPKSPADNAGVSIGDEILAINDMQIREEGSGTNFGNWCNYYTEDTKEINLTISSAKRLKNIVVKLTDDNYYSTMSIQRIEKPTEEQEMNWKLFKKEKL